MYIQLFNPHNHQGLPHRKHQQIFEIQSMAKPIHNPFNSMKRVDIQDLHVYSEEYNSQ